MANPFTDHPAQAGESYSKHLAFAGRHGFLLIAAGAACLLHAFLPFLFARTASASVERIHDELLHRKSGRR